MIHHRSLKIYIVLFLLDTLGCCDISFGNEPIVKTKFIADHSTIATGDSFRVGVLFTIPEGYHIYWQNPGDAGLRSTIDIICPDGLKIGSLYWPLPDQLEEVGGLKVNVYTDEVLIFANVLMPADYRKTSVIFKANLEWMVCKEACALEKSDLVLTLPCAEKSLSNETTGTIYDKYEKLIPRTIREFPYLTVALDLSKDRHEINNRVVSEMRIQSLDPNKTFVLDKQTIQWFEGPVGNTIPKTVTFDRGKSTAQVLVFRLETNEAGKQNKTGLVLWAVVKFKMKMERGSIVQHGLIINREN